MLAVHVRTTLLPAFALFVLAAVALVLAAAPADADAADRARQRLVVRGDATAVQGPCSERGVCPLELENGRFRGAPVGAGAYTGSLRLKVAEQFPNGEGGICAPLKGRIVLGAGSADRLVLAVAGDSCQDGGGPLAGASFTGLAHFVITHGTGRYAHTIGAGRVQFSEDAAHDHRMTVIGAIAG